MIGDFLGAVSLFAIMYALFFPALAVWLIALEVRPPGAAVSLDNPTRRGKRHDDRI